MTSGQWSGEVGWLHSLWQKLLPYVQRIPTLRFLTSFAAFLACDAVRYITDWVKSLLPQAQLG